MIRKIIHIDEEKCNGCGICAAACHEGAIAMVDGKAKLTREDFCDGFGDCLPGCPTGAIRFEEREAPAYDEAAVKAMQSRKKAEAREMQARETQAGERMPADQAFRSRLNQWPCQLRLVSARASFFEGADLLIAADCTAYAYAGFHEEFMKGKITLIGCPKLDDADYADKLTAIIRDNGIRSVTIVRMEVPCCGGLERAARKALQNSGKSLPCQVVTVSRDGKLLE